MTLAKEYVKQRYQKPGNVYLGVVSRLDAPVTGVVLLARTSKAAARLTEQFRSRGVEKSYWAVVEGVVEPADGRLVDWLAEDERHRRMHIVGPTMPGAKEARLAYRRLSVVGGNSWLEVELETGRKHQIRLQFSQSRPSGGRRSEVRQRRAVFAGHRVARPAAGDFASHDGARLGIRSPAAAQRGGDSASRDVDGSTGIYASPSGSIFAARGRPLGLPMRRADLFSCSVAHSVTNASARGGR